MRHARVLVCALGLASLAGAVVASDNTTPTVAVTSEQSSFTKVALGPDGSRNVLDIVTLDPDGLDHQRLRRYPLVGAAQTCTLPLEARALVVQPDGKLVAAGNAELLVAVVRLQATGCAIDPTFGQGGIVTRSLPPESRADEVAIQSDGKIVLAGRRVFDTATAEDILVMRLHPDGSDDTGFGSSGALTVAFNLAGGNNRDVATALALQSDGKIVVGGEANATEGDRPVLARLTSNGALDTTFSGDGKMQFAYTDSIAVAGIVIQPDQKIAVMLSGLPRWLLMLTSSGSYDSSFAGGGAFELDPIVPNVASIVGQSDGKLLVAGYDHPDSGVVARFTKAGDLDRSFGNGGTVTIPFNPDGMRFRDVAHRGGLIVAVGSKWSDSVYDSQGIRVSLATSLVFTDTFTYGLHPWSSQVGAVDRVFQPIFGNFGTWRLRAPAQSGQPAYVETDEPTALNYVKVRFDLRAGGLTAGRATVLELREEGAGQSVGVVEVERSGSIHRVRARIRENDGLWLSTGWTYLAEVEHEITVEWYRDFGTTPPLLEGRIRLSVDGTFQDEVWAANDDHRVGRVRLGATAAVGASGTLQFDDFGSWRF